MWDREPTPTPAMPTPAPPTPMPDPMSPDALEAGRSARLKAMSGGRLSTQLTTWGAPGGPAWAGAAPLAAGGTFGGAKTGAS